MKELYTLYIVVSTIIPTGPRTTKNYSSLPRSYLAEPTRANNNKKKRRIEKEEEEEA